MSIRDTYANLMAERDYISHKLYSTPHPKGEKLNLWIKRMDIVYNEIEEYWKQFDRIHKI
jgi:hypothetical protein